MQNLLNHPALAAALPDRLPFTIAQRTRRVYDRLAAFYPLSTMFFHSRAHRRAMADSGIRDGMQVLEIATGSGEMFRRLVRVNRGGATLGLDLSPNMAARTQHRVSKEFPGSVARCHAVDARFLPFRDEFFDAIVCCYLLELLSQDDILRTLSEIRRVLKCGGTFTLVLIGEKTELFNRLYRVLGSLAPAFWGRQIEQRVTDFLTLHDLRILSDCTVRQSFYPSRVLTARK
ncbi:MAG: methyltransferase domain-containing protein [Acidobacteria bacterium]|nr:methyltransferase domain-containing protein [Acidobacteriota bacterium]